MSTNEGIAVWNKCTVANDVRNKYSTRNLCSPMNVTTSRSRASLEATRRILSKGVKLYGPNSRCNSTCNTGGLRQAHFGGPLSLSV